MNWVELSPEWIPEQEGLRKVKISGRYICLIRHQDQLYATSVRCPHAGADLSGGWCEHGRLICPYHRHAFDLQNGRGDTGQGNYITAYPLKHENGQWYIGLKKSGFRNWFG